MSGADQQATFAVDLKTSGATETETLADALQRLREQIKMDETALGQMQAALRRLQQAGATETSTYKELRDQIAAKRASLGELQEQYIKLGGTFEDFKGKTGATSGEVGGILNKLRELLTTAEGAGGPVGDLAGRFSQLSDKLKGGGLVGALLLVIATLVAVGIAAVKAGIALFLFAVRAADTARSAALLRESATGSATGAAALGAQIEGLSRRVALGRSKLEEMGLALVRTRLQGAALAYAFSAIATATGAAGDGVGSTLRGIAERAAQARVFMLSALDLEGTGLQVQDVGAALAKRLGVSLQTAVAAIQSGRVRVEAGLQALNDAVQAKFGGIARRQTLAFNYQLEKARENVARLFAGIKIEPFLEGLQEVLLLLDEQTATGKALRVILESVFNPLIGGVSKAFPYIKAFFQGMIVFALILVVGILKVRNALRDAFGGSSIFKNVDGLRLAFYAGAGAAGLITVALVVLTAALTVLAIAFLIVAAPILAVMTLLFAVGFAIGYVAGLLIDGFMSAVDFISGLDLSEAAKNIIDGLVNGIRSGVSRVVGAVKGLGDSAVSAFKNVWGIASPSRVAGELAGNITGTFSHEIDAGAGDVESSVADMADRSVKAFDPAPTGRTGGARRQAAVHIDKIEINGVRGIEDLSSERLRALLAEAIEGALRSAGVSLEEV